MNWWLSSLSGLSLELFLGVTLVFGFFAQGPTLAQPTWEPPHSEEHGKLDAARLKRLPDSAFAFLEVRKEPMTDAAHVRSAIARFAQVKGVTDAERDVAFANIEKAAQYFGVKMKETDWRQLGRRSHPRNTAQGAR